VRTFALAAVLLPACLALASGQAPSPRGSVAAPPDRPFRAGVDVVSITATVVDANGGYVSGLTREDFEVFEDGQPQPITHFTGERVPVSLGLVLDVSDTMFGQRLKDARAAVSAFLFTLLSADDEFFVIAFNHAPRTLVEWSHSPNQVEARLNALYPSGGTAIYDAMMAAIPLFDTRNRQRAAMVLITDGEDNSSDHTARDVRAQLLRSDAFVYGIGVDSPDRRAINRDVDMTTLWEVTSDTGGRAERVHNTTDLRAATARIADDLNHQYVLGYTSLKKPDGQYHSIRVKAKPAGLKVRARRGYVATKTR
jgi:Ca-activated chloride channel family protein